MPSLLSSVKTIWIFAPNESANNGISTLATRHGWLCILRRRMWLAFSQRFGSYFGCAYEK
jgi:hypothetical protein